MFHEAKSMPNPKTPVQNYVVPAWDANELCQYMDADIALNLAKLGSTIPPPTPLTDVPQGACDEVLQIVDEWKEALEQQKSTDECGLVVLVLKMLDDVDDPQVLLFCDNKPLEALDHIAESVKELYMAALCAAQQAEKQQLRFGRDMLQETLHDIDLDGVADTKGELILAVTKFVLAVHTNVLTATLELTDRSHQHYFENIPYDDKPPYFGKDVRDKAAQKALEISKTLVLANEHIEQLDATMESALQGLHASVVGRLLLGL